jgi:radical SAM superfamily enzyme YgiQ (UPF0313 family)
MNRRILFINAINPSRDIEVVYPPLGLGYLISSLKERFGPNYAEFKIINTDIEDEIRNFKPDIVGITSVSQNYNRAKEFARIAKTYGLPVIMGGVHISLLPTTLTKDMDIGVIGEGEETIIELFALFEKTGSFKSSSLKLIDGIIFWENGALNITNKRRLILPLDRIPLPAREFFIIKDTAHIFSSRGCPYKCSFCASTRFWDTTRFFSAEYVVNEIKYLIMNYNIRVIQFCDDLFVADRKRLRKIIEILGSEQILGKVFFSCSARSNLVDDELAQLLKRMHVPVVAIGMESACPSSLEYLKGGNITPRDHIRAIETLGKYGIETGASFIIGSPQETKEDIWETLRFIKKSKLSGFDTYVLTPYPGTPIWDYARERELVSEDMDWDILDVNFGRNHEKAVILSEKLTRDEIYRLFLLFAEEKRRWIIKTALKHPLQLFKNPKSITDAIRRVMSGKPLIEIER